MVVRRVPVVSRSWHDVVFRLAEIGVALWFPCVLWNSMAPERLWLLNPRRLLARQLDDERLADLLAHHQDTKVGPRTLVAMCVCVRVSVPEILAVLQALRWAIVT